MLNFDDREWFTARCRGLDIKKARDRKFILIQCQCLGISYDEGCKILGIENIAPIISKRRLTEDMREQIDNEPNVIAPEWVRRFGKGSPSAAAIHNYRLKMGYAKPSTDLFSQSEIALIINSYNEGLGNEQIKKRIKDEFNHDVTKQQVASKIAHLVRLKHISSASERGIRRCNKSNTN